MTELIAPLFDGPVDIVGDIHGEIDALDALLTRLGYDRDGRHARGRRLVFVGDLVDRGPDSPAVVERVAAMHTAGRAQCVLGNHELNLLLGDFKEGNGWFREAGDDHDLAAGKPFVSARASTGQRRQFLDWFATLPLALERDDLRVVHACWQAGHIARLRGQRQAVAALHRQHSQCIEQQLVDSGLHRQRQRELAEYGPTLTDPGRQPPALTGIATCDSRVQSDHPVKALTSGLEQPTDTPFFAGGKWRMSARVPWWRDYDDGAAVVFGHYWRQPGAQPGRGRREGGPELFDHHQPLAWLGPRGNALCVDWCVGKRWKERADGARQYHGRLGALRWDSRDIVLDTDLPG